MSPLIGTEFHELPVEEWWSGETVFVHDEVQYTRKLIVLSAADKDGGAHVDEDLEDYYEVLRAGEYAIGISRDFDPPGVTIYPTNAHLALLRQFAHEMLASATHYGWM
ncbi:hypothetical protein A3Q40_02964 [Rhodococcus sp. PBTS 1]|nr:hypothetical protein A3Q40_02964 [Rhodococcus sp. PBTS 1]